MKDTHIQSAEVESWLHARLLQLYTTFNLYFDVHVLYGVRLISTFYFLLSTCTFYFLFSITNTIAAASTTIVLPQLDSASTSTSTSSSTFIRLLLKSPNPSS